MNKSTAWSLAAVRKRRQLNAYTIPIVLTTSIKRTFSKWQSSSTIFTNSFISKISNACMESIFQVCTKRIGIIIMHKICYLGMKKIDPWSEDTSLKLDPTFRNCCLLPAWTLKEKSINKLKSVHKAWSNLTHLWSFHQPINKTKLSLLISEIPTFVLFVASAAKT